jgi:hypothetical protein
MNLFPSSGDGWETTTLLGPLKRANLNHCITYVSITTAIRARVWSSGICGGQNGAGAGFLRVLRFPLPIFIPPIAPQSPSSIIWGCTIG